MSGPSIRSKLAMIFAGGFLAFVGLGVFSLMQLSEVNAVTQEIREKWFPRLETLGGLRVAVTTHHLLAARRTQRLDFRELAATGAQITSLSNDINADMRKLSAGLETETEQAIYAKLKADWLSYRQSFARVVVKLNSGDISAAHAAFTDETGPALERVKGQLGALETYAETQAELAKAGIQNVYERARLLLLLVIGGTAIVALASVLWVSRAVSAPLLRVSKVMRRLTDSVQGDRKTAQIANKKDEIGTLVSAVSTYRACIARVRNLAEVSELDRIRLETAITNMPVGLSIFDRDNKLLICNEVYARMYKLSPDLMRPGTPHADMNAERVRQGTFYGEDPDSYYIDLAMTITSKKPVTTLRRLHDGRVFSVMFQPLKDGWLSVHEDITERQLAERRIQHLASHDELTNLANRRKFNEEVADAFCHLGRSEKFAVLCIDLDRFKNVNDTFGHPVGDKLLKKVAQRLTACVGERDIVARFGGDEFAILLKLDNKAGLGPDSGDDHADDLAQNLIAALSQTFFIDNNKISIGCSVGIARAPNDGSSAPQLLKNADMALFTAKEEGRGVCRFYTPAMHKSVSDRLKQEAELRQALEDNAFSLFYQPIVSLETNSIVGFEALLRWKQSRRRWLTPGAFISVAEDSGLIVPLGEWVLKQACLDAKDWPLPLNVAVNLSPVQLRNHRITETVQNALSVSGLTANRLELEITEGVLLDRTEDVLQTLKALNATGAGIALDDFGTGYSALSYLHSFPFNKIKIDGSFVRRASNDASSAAIIRAVAELGSSLGMATTAEGVETRDQLERVREAGCSQAQGFLFSEPRPSEDIADLVLEADLEKCVRAG